MVEQKVELRKIRDFSENLNDTFGFIKQNLKPLLLSFVGIAGVFMLATAIVNGIFQSQMGGMFQQLFAGRLGGNASITTSFFGPTYFLMLLLGVVNFVAMKVTVIAFLKLYEQNGNVAPTMGEVWKEFSKYFFKVFFLTIPILILIGIGSVFCLVPGIWLAVVFAPFEMMIMVEDRSFGDAFNRCFVIIKDNFWMSLGIYFVAILIYYFCSMIVGVVVGIIAGGISWMSTKDFGSTVGIVTSILNVFSFFFFIIYFVSVVLNYFNLTEKYEGTGMMKRLDTIGGAAPDIHNTEEEY